MKTKSSERSFTAGKAVLLLSLVMFPVSLLHVFFHETGHALVALFSGETEIQLFFHPFAFSSYSRPSLTAAGSLYHLAAPLAGLLLPFVLFWFARRSQSFAGLFLVLLFPWSLFLEGLNMIAVLTGTGDFYHIASLTGIPVAVFAVLAVLMMLTGILLIDACLPRVGLSPSNLHAIWVVPLSVALWVLLSLPVALWLIPNSPFVVQWQLQEEIRIVSQMWLVLMTAVGLLIGAMHVTGYRRIERVLPEKYRQPSEFHQVARPGFRYSGLP